MSNGSGIFTKVQKGFIDALFPRRCPVCGCIAPPVPLGTAGASGADSRICPPCLNRLSFVRSPVCKKCGKEVLSETQEYCFDCTRHKRSFEYGVSLLNYNEAAGSSMAAVKYKNKREYLDYYAQKGLERTGRILGRMNADALVPVPVHPARYRRRGFNQAEVLAEKLSEGLGLPNCPELLMRTKRTEPQKSLDPSGRLKNLEKAFFAGAAPPAVKAVILIDDIYTTGSTMEACSRALLRAGIKKVYFFTLCIGQGQ